MSNQYQLVGLGNSELLAGLSELVGQSNVLTAQVLAHLVELEERKLHLELGHSSLFAYCVEALAMSEGSAGRRVTAARLCRRFPEGFERVARGELHLCALCALAPHLVQKTQPNYSTDVEVRLGDRSRNFSPHAFRGLMYANRSVGYRCAPKCKSRPYSKLRQHLEPSMRPSRQLRPHK